MGIPVGRGQVLKSAPQLPLQTQESTSGGVKINAGQQSLGLGSFYKRLVVPAAEEKSL